MVTFALAQEIKEVCSSSSLISLFILQTFYRENLDMKSAKNNGNNLTSPTNQNKNLFMPNFTTQPSFDPDSSKNSVISQWENLIHSSKDVLEEFQDSDSDFSEMKSENLAPIKVRKVIGQLKSEKEESKKPETWAMAVQGVRSVPPENIGTKPTLGQK